MTIIKEGNQTPKDVLSTIINIKGIMEMDDYWVLEDVYSPNIKKEVVFAINVNFHLRDCSQGFYVDKDSFFEVSRHIYLDSVVQPEDTIKVKIDYPTVVGTHLKDLKVVKIYFQVQVV